MIARKRAEMPAPPAPPPLTKAVATVLRELSPPLTDEEIARREAERVARYKAQEHERKMRQRRGIWDQLIRDRGSRYANCTLANYEITTDQQRAEVERLRDYSDHVAERISEGQSIIWIGPAGTGKDHLMIALCYAAIGECKTVVWKNGTSLWVDFRSCIGSERDEWEVIRELTAPDLLCISDPLPPRGPLTDYQASNLLTIIDERYSRQKPTWVTINAANRQESEERLGSQVVDRLGHGALIVRCNWKSYRRDS